MYAGSRSESQTDWVFICSTLNASVECINTGVVRRLRGWRRHLCQRTYSPSPAWDFAIHTRLNRSRSRCGNQRTTGRRQSSSPRLLRNDRCADGQIRCFGQVLSWRSAGRKLRHTDGRRVCDPQVRRCAFPRWKPSGIPERHPDSQFGESSNINNSSLPASDNAGGPDRRVYGCHDGRQPTNERFLDSGAGFAGWNHSREDYRGGAVHR